MGLLLLLLLLLFLSAAELCDIFQMLPPVEQSESTVTAGLVRSPFPHFLDSSPVETCHNADASALESIASPIEVATTLVKNKD